MRRSAAISAAAAVVALGVGGYLWARSVNARPSPPPYAFDMCVVHSSGTPTGHPAWNDAVLSGVARTLSPPERAALEDALGASATRWEAKANPMLEDLEGGDPDAPITAWFKTAPSFVKTAQTSSRLRACAPDGFCALPRARGGPCPEESAAPANADEADRARFLLWPWGHALRFHAASPDAARDAAGALRARVRESHAIAIVMTAEDAEVTKVAPFATMRERWGRVNALSRLARHEKAPPTSGAFVVDERPNDVIVLPRHEAMSDPSPDALIEVDVKAAAPQLAR